MKKLLGLLVCVVFVMTQTGTYAANAIDKALKAVNMHNKGAISVSVKDINTGKNIYSFNSHTPFNPASTQKILTLAASLDTLGNDYKFITELYKSSNNELYFKLGADPFLSSKNLEQLLSTAKSKNVIEPKNVYIDDYILDSEYWGEGWQWDDDINPLMPKFGSYNLDGNVVKVIIRPTKLKAPADIYMKEFYPIGFVNNVTTGNEDKVTLTHNKSISENLIELNGTVVEQVEKFVPVNNIKRYFRLRLEEAFNSAKIVFYGKLYQKKLPAQNVYLVDKVEHDMSLAVDEVLKNSNNMVAETVFKLAGGKYVNNTGSISTAVSMLNDYCKKNGLDTSYIRIVDGSGVSKNNLMTAEFMTNFLVMLSKQDNFDDFNISAKTQKGDLVITGENLKIAKLDVDSGELLVDGLIQSVFYSESTPQKSTSFFGRLMK